MKCLCLLDLLNISEWSVNDTTFANQWQDSGTISHCNKLADLQ